MSKLVSAIEAFSNVSDNLERIEEQGISDKGKIRSAIRDDLQSGLLLVSEMESLPAEVRRDLIHDASESMFFTGELAADEGRTVELRDFVAEILHQLRRHAAPGVHHEEAVHKPSPVEWSDERKLELSN